MSLEKPAPAGAAWPWCGGAPEALQGGTSLEHRESADRLFASLLLIREKLSALSFLIIDYFAASSLCYFHIVSFKHLFLNYVQIFFPLFFLNHFKYPVEFSSFVLQSRFY